MAQELDTIKHNLKRALANASKIIPCRIRRIIVEAFLPTLPIIDCYDLFSSVAEKLKIERILVSGNHGVFESLAGDTAILKEYALKGTWAERTVQMVERELRGSNGTYIDIGANIGLTVIPIAKIGFIKCFAFEPEPNNFLSLEHNAVRNAKGSGLKLFQLALSDTSGTVKLSISKGNLGDHRLITADEAGLPDERDRPKIEVPTEQLDSLNLDITSPLVIKIDTQGAEGNILKGGEQTIGKAKLLIMEFWPYGISKFQKSVSEMLNFLDRNFVNISYAAGEDGVIIKAENKQQALRDLSDYFERNLTQIENFVDIIASK